MIRCTTCGSDNKDTAPYCISCGNKFHSTQKAMRASPIKCYSCYFINPPYTTMCKKCGKSLISEMQYQTRQDNYTANHLVGIGGWLIVVVIGLCQSILFSGFAVVLLLVVKNMGAIRPEMETSHNIMIASCIVLMILPIIGLILMFNRKRIFRSYMIAMQIVNLGSPIITFFFPSLFGEYNLGSGFITSSIASIVWIAYFRKSERVRKTFIY